MKIIEGKDHSKELTGDPKKATGKKYGIIIPYTKMLSLNEKGRDIGKRFLHSTVADID